MLDGWHDNNTEVLQKVSAEEESRALAVGRRGSYDRILGRVIGQIEKEVPEFFVNALKRITYQAAKFSSQPVATTLGVTKINTLVDINLWRMRDQTEYLGRKLEWDAWLLTSLVRKAQILPA